MKHPRPTFLSILPLLGALGCGTPAGDDVDSDVPATVFTSSGAVDAPGPLTVGDRVAVDADPDHGLPVPLVVTAPTEPGSYAVVLFLHGFQLGPDNYEGLHAALASHGFVVVAPQMPGGVLDAPATTVEAGYAADVLAWLPDHLDGVAGVDAVPEVVGIAGHSRGGKVGWRLLDGDPTAALALMGIDPVDTDGMGTDTRVVDGDFTFAVPTLVEGTGLGPVGAGGFGQACAPEGDNHEQFFGASPSPSTHVVVPDYGHMDMVDPDCGFLCNVCSGAEDPAPMRTLTAGLLVGFFRATLQGDAPALDAALGETAVPIVVTRK